MIVAFYLQHAWWWSLGWQQRLSVKCAKSHKIVFRSRRLRRKAGQPAPPCTDIERVDWIYLCISHVYSGPHCSSENKQRWLFLFWIREIVAKEL